ncbi:MAG: hypothetical protein WDO16_07050 [Bacteroidota bacterium]
MKDTSLLRVYRLDSAARKIDSAASAIKESNKQQADAIQQNIQTVGDKLEQSIGSISLKIDSIPARVTKDNAEKNKDIIAAIPFYCNVQMFCIIRKNAASGNYELILYNNDTLPKVQNKQDSLYLKKYSTEQTIDYTSFRNWLQKEYTATGKSAQDSCAGKTDFLYAKIQDKINQYENAKINNRNKQQVDSLVQLLVDYDRVAGELRLNTEVPVYALKPKNDSKDDDTQKGARKTKRDRAALKKQIQSIQEEAEVAIKRRKLPVPDYSRRIGTMKIIKARVQVDDNKIFDISFDADVYDTRGKLIRRLNTISNNSYSLSFKGLNNREF